MGVNRFTEAEPSPLGTAESILRVDPGVEAELVADVQEWRRRRDGTAWQRTLDALRRAASSSENVMPATIAFAEAGGTTGRVGRRAAGGVRRVPGPHRCGRRHGHAHGRPERRWRSGCAP